MDMFLALAEPNRRDIIEIIAKRGELPATEIYKRFNVSHPAISQHLKILRESGFVKVRKRAQQRMYKLDPKTIFKFEKWAKDTIVMWDARFDTLDDVLIREKEKVSKAKK